MKIIKFRDIDKPEKLEIDVIPDSAIQKSGKPFFVPDFANDFKFRTATAIHICRLGKNITSKFAGRYYEEAGLCLVFEAADMLTALKSEGKPTALATAFDASHITGEMTAVDKAMLGRSDAVLTIDGNETDRATTPSAADFDRCIETASRYFTLKIGDLIIIESGKWNNAKINSRVSASLGDFESVNIKIK